MFIFISDIMVNEVQDRGCKQHAGHMYKVRTGVTIKNPLETMLQNK